MPGRKIVDEADAHACLNAVAESCQPRAAWARAHGVDARSLNAWRLILERRKDVADLPTLRLLELVPKSTEPAQSGVRIRVGGLVVELDRTFDHEVLAAVLDVVVPC